MELEFSEHGRRRFAGIIPLTGRERGRALRCAIPDKIGKPSSTRLTLMIYYPRDNSGFLM